MQLKTPKDLAIKARMLGKKTVSYSQFSRHKNCPKSWKLAYIDKETSFDPSIFLIFGTAFHETMQAYLDTMYKESIVAAEKSDVNNILLTSMRTEHAKVVAECGEDFSDPKQLAEFYQDGVEIMSWFKKNRGAYFAKKNTELVGIEMPILHTTESNENVMLMGFLDIVMKEHDKIKIYDIKTSTRGWKAAQKSQNGDQLRLYKKFFAKQYNVDEKDIEVEYFICKRKLWENCDFPQKRIQVVRPSSGKPSLNKVMRELDSFISNAFTPEGKHNKESNYPATAGIKKANCKWCEYRDREDLCPKSERIVE